MSPFKPVGDVARWRILYGLLVDTPVGALLTYEAMADALGLDPVRQRAAISSAMRRAAEEHEEKDKRAVEAVRDEGYRVVDVEDHLRLAHIHGRRAGTQLEIAYSKVTNVDLSGVDPEIRKGFELVARGFVEQMEINRRLSGRQRRMEKVLDGLTEHSGRTEEELTQLRERLKALETRLEGSGQHPDA